MPIDTKIPISNMLVPIDELSSFRAYQLDHACEYGLGTDNDGVS
jgi:hypothetical protein